MGELTSENFDAIDRDLAARASRRHNEATDQLLDRPPAEIIRMAAQHIVMGQEGGNGDWSRRQFAHATALANLAMARMAEQQAGAPDAIPQSAPADEPQMTPEWDDFHGQSRL